MSERSVTTSRHAIAHDRGMPAWRAFLLAHSMITRRLDDELREREGLSLAEYDALLQLASSPRRRLRMSQLADKVLLSRSGVTRLIDRLEDDRLVCRESCVSDARGAEAVLTEAGLNRLRDASTTHLDGVARYFLTVLDADQLDSLAGSLGEVIDRMSQDGAGTGATPELAGRTEATAPER
jgi:DNA-binding MarR family transcriptional regulator